MGLRGPKLAAALVRQDFASVLQESQGSSNILAKIGNHLEMPRLGID